MRTPLTKQQYKDLQNLQRALESLRSEARRAYHITESVNRSGGGAVGNALHRVAGYDLALYLEAFRAQLGPLAERLKAALDESYGIRHESFTEED
jgi:hypothetical protein